MSNAKGEPLNPTACFSLLKLHMSLAMANGIMDYYKIQCQKCSRKDCPWKPIFITYLKNTRKTIGVFLEKTKDD
jgi:hypothetical protein